LSVISGIAASRSLTSAIILTFALALLCSFIGWTQTAGRPEAQRKLQDRFIATGIEAGVVGRTADTCGRGLRHKTGGGGRPDDGMPNLNRQGMSGRERGAGGGGKINNEVAPERMRDRVDWLDADGKGSVTREELAAAGPGMLGNLRP
jgi:hypothetical protein